MILSIHIPKTAGVSFRRILAQLFEEDFVLKYWTMTDAHGRTITEIPRHVRCVHGHFPPDALLGDYPDAKLITWVRNPVERVVSSYHHRLRDPDWAHPVTRELHEKKLSLLEFARIELMRNEMARYFGSKQPRAFSFIGVTERFDASLDIFRRTFNLREVPVMRENCNPERATEYYQLDHATRQEIARLNEQDVDIYRQACLLMAGAADGIAKDFQPA